MERVRLAVGAFTVWQDAQDQLREGTLMAEHLILVVSVLGGSDEADEIAGLVSGLRAELLDLDVEAVEPVEDTELPEGAKGPGTLFGTLSVSLGIIDRLQSVVDSLREWTGRTGRTVEVRLGDDTLRVSSASAAQQERIIEDWIARQHGTLARPTPQIRNDALS